MKHRSRRRTAFVYIAITRQTGHVKIGVACDPFERICDLQTSNHEEVCLAGYVCSERPLALERELHDRFAATHVRGEWFAWSDDLDAFCWSEMSKDFDALREMIEPAPARAPRGRITAPQQRRAA